MKRTLLSAALATAFATAVTMAAPASSAQPDNAPPLNAPGQNKLVCFDGPSEGTIYSGSCTLIGRGAMGPAILNNSSDDPDGDYSGVYYENSSIYGSLLSDITQLGYKYTGTIDPMPGNLSMNLPIDTTGDGLSDGYAFIDAYYCPGTAGVVDVIHDDECGIWYLGVEYGSWVEFIAAFPIATVATDNFAFVVAERTPTEPAATWRVWNVKFGKPGR